jgi:hypothetical protein
VELAALPFDTISAVGLCVFGVLAFVRGWVYSKSAVTALTAMRDDRIKELAAERDDYRATVRLKDESLRELAGQNRELLELAKTGNALMRALTSATGREPL